MKINQSHNDTHSRTGGSNLLLFGLSADMPHYGHINWISRLKAALPGHQIIVMPCNANPLGKIDKSGNIIYPSNGFLRWQMLFEYYQENDPEIIVSQYEVAINTPSKTFDTLQYLLHTPIFAIKSQRGFILPKPDKAQKFNNVSIAIGTDLINELSNWYKWDEILKSANLVIMQRAGYNFNFNIENKILKNKILNGKIDGSIQLLDGPEVDISSRQLKSMLRNSGSDNQLLKYIPEQILTFIRKHQSEFSSAYYQNNDARKTFDQAMRIYKNTVAEYNKNRQSELNTYICDLIPFGKIDAMQSHGFKLNNGRLTINLNKINHSNMQETLDNWFQKLNCPWYQPKLAIGKIISPQEFNANFKILGKYGPNLAVDLIVFVRDENTDALQLLTIKRNNDKKTLAIPGGFYQGDILKTVVNEFLEECCSNSLFNLNSRSLQLVSTKYQDNKEELINKLTDVIKKHGKEIAIYIDLNKNPDEILITALTAINENTQTNNNPQQLVATIKCELYQRLLPEQFNKLQRFFKSLGIISHQEPCITDQRNTNQAWMVTKVVRFMLNQNEFQNLLESCCIEISGGDDAAAAQIISLNDFCEQDNTFAFHKYLVLRTLAKFEEEGK